MRPHEIPGLVDEPQLDEFPVLGVAEWNHGTFEVLVRAGCIVRFRVRVADRSNARLRKKPLGVLAEQEHSVNGGGHAALGWCRKFEILQQSLPVIDIVRGRNTGA